MINPECAIDQFNEGTPYLIGPAPLVAYTLDDFRVEVADAVPAQLSVSRQPGLLGSPYCIELKTTIQKTSIAALDNDNVERWIDPVDMRAWQWGTPYAQPLTVAFDVQGAVPGDYSIGMSNWSNGVSCVGRYTVSTTAGRVSVTFPAITSGDWSQGAKLVTDLGFGDAYATSTEGVWQSIAAWRVTGLERLTMQPVGSYLRFGRFQFNVGTVALPFRYIPMSEQLAQCQRFLFKTMPQGTPVKTAMGLDGSLKEILVSQDAGSGAGIMCNLRLPVEMISLPLYYAFSPGLNDKNWFRANGGVSSGVPSFWLPCKNGVGVQNPSVAGDPNGSCYFLHVVASAQRGGNGWLT